VIIVGGGILAATWYLLDRLARRGHEGSIVLSLAMALFAAGMTIMLAGYLKGGAVALLLGAAVGGASATATAMKTPQTAALAIGVVGLFSLAFIGRFFGGLSTLAAFTLCSAPLLGWISELPWLGQRAPGKMAALRLAVVALALAVVLILAKRHFDQHMAPLL
jgi:hypothetical protein